MEKQSFNLNEAVKAWRNDLRSRGISSEVIEELEGHLFESVETLQSTGLSENESFRLAVERMGDPAEQLNASPTNSSPTEERPERSGCSKTIGIALLATGCALVLAAMAAIVATYLMPKEYLGKVIVQVNYQKDPAIAYQTFQQTQFAIIESQETLSEVIHETRLTKQWGMSEARCSERLRKKIKTEGIRGTDLIQISIHDPDPDLAATLANSLAQTYKSRINDPTAIQIHELAKPHRTPSKPNVVLQITLAVALGAIGFLGVIIGFVVLRVR